MADLIRAIIRVPPAIRSGMGQVDNLLGRVIPRKIIVYLSSDFVSRVF